MRSISVCPPFPSSLTDSIKMSRHQCYSMLRIYWSNRPRINFVLLWNIQAFRCLKYQYSTSRSNNGPTRRRYLRADKNQRCGPVEFVYALPLPTGVWRMIIEKWLILWIKKTGTKIQSLLLDIMDLFWSMLRDLFPILSLHVTVQYRLWQYTFFCQ